MGKIRSNPQPGVETDSFIPLGCSESFGSNFENLICKSSVNKMNHCALQNTFTACEEMAEMSRLRTSFTIQDRKEALVCPKPRRLGLVNHGINDPVKPIRWHLSHQVEQNDSKAGTELLEIILTKGGYGGDQSPTQVACSPPYFCGSPPSRAANPVVHDVRFSDQRLPPAPVPVPGSSGSPASRKGCVRATFGPKPAAVRIEGFDCLDRDRRRCSIPAMA